MAFQEDALCKLKPKIREYPQYNQMKILSRQLLHCPLKTLDECRLPRTEVILRQWDDMSAAQNNNYTNVQVQHGEHLVVGTSLSGDLIIL